MSEQSGKNLIDYCSRVAQSLTQGGYTIIHGRDFTSCEDPAVREKAERHVRRARMLAVLGRNEFLLNAIESVRSGLHAYTMADEKIVVLPDRDGLLEKMAASCDLGADKLRGIGLTDGHCHAAVFLHEASHIMGNDGWGWDDKRSPLVGEFQVQALATARFIKASGLPARHPIVRFLDAQNFASLREGMVKSEDEDPRDCRHDWVMTASEWVQSRIDSRPGTWDDAKNAFSPEVFKSFRGFGDPEKPVVESRPFKKALFAIRDSFRSHGNRIDERPALQQLRDMSAQAARAMLVEARHEEVPSAKRDAHQAAAILRQFARNLDLTQQYADDYTPAPRPSL